MFDMGEEIQQDATVTDDPGTWRGKKVGESFCSRGSKEGKKRKKIRCYAEIFKESAC